jgi:hypothetical protein
MRKFVDTVGSKVLSVAFVRRTHPYDNEIPYKLDHDNLLSSGGGNQHLPYPTDMLVPARYSIQQSLACSDGRHREARA